MTKTTRWQEIYPGEHGNELIGEPIIITTVNKSISYHYAYVEYLLDKGLWWQL